MIVNRPQFDVQNIILGSAYWLKKRGSMYINNPAIVIEVTPLNIKLTFYGDHSRMEEISLKIEDFVTGMFKLEQMVKYEELPSAKVLPLGEAKDKENLFD